MCASMATISNRSVLPRRDYAVGCATCCENLSAHSREGGNPALCASLWIPACAGMSGECGRIRLPARHAAAAPRRACADPTGTATAIARAAVTRGRSDNRRGILERVNAGSTALLVLRTRRQCQSSKHKNRGTQRECKLPHKTFLLNGRTAQKRNPAKSSLREVCGIVFTALSRAPLPRCLTTRSSNR
jgi:hypothetical protein